MTMSEAYSNGLADVRAGEAPNVAARAGGFDACYLQGYYHGAVVQPALTLYATEGPQHRKVGRAQIQALFHKGGGFRETQYPVVYLAYSDGHEDKPNTVDAWAIIGPDYASTHEHLGQVGWRPEREGLFICG